MALSLEQARKFEALGRNLHPQEEMVRAAAAAVGITGKDLTELLALFRLKAGAALMQHPPG